jgi:hypothetical protein
MSDDTGSTADDADGSGEAAADRSSAEGDRDSGPRPGDDTDAETATAEPDGTAAADGEAATDGAASGDGATTETASGEAASGDGATAETTTDETASGDADGAGDVPPDVRKYERFTKMDGARYERVNEFLRDRTYITAREWAIARLCADFRTETGVEMTKIGENLPELVPFMTDTYTPQAVNQARYSFEEKVTKAGATFLYGAMSGFFTAEDLDEMMYEVTEVAKFLLEVEGVDLAVADELEAEDKISEVMREVRASSADLRGEEVRCPECGHVHEPTEE